MTPTPRNRLTIHNHGMCQQTDRKRSLSLQHARQVRISHGGEWVIPHRAFRQQLVADEQMSVHHRPSVLGKARAGDRDLLVELGKKRLGDRADIAFVS